MKKTMFFALVVSGLAVSFFVGNLMSQDRSPRPQQLVSQDEAEFSAGSSGPVDPQLHSLRSQLLELTQRHIKTMKEEELNAAIDRLRKQIAEHTTEEKLQQANKILHEIVKNYPETRAAKQAGMMLKSGSAQLRQPRQIKYYVGHER